MNPDAVDGFFKETEKQSRKRWRCGSCDGLSRKRRNFRHLVKGCKGQVTYRHNISRMIYMGHKIIYGVTEPFDHCKWQCRFCKYEWISFDGHWCPSCKRHAEEAWISSQVNGQCCICHASDKLVMAKIDPEGVEYKDNIIPVCNQCALDIRWKPKLGERGYEFSKNELLGHRLQWLEICAPKCDGSWYRALKGAP